MLSLKKRVKHKYLAAHEPLMFEAVLRGEPPSCWIRDTLNKYRASVSIIDIKPLGNREGVQELFEIRVNPELVESVISDLRKSTFAKEVEVVRPSSGRIYGSARVLGHHICNAFINSKCFLISVNSAHQRLVDWTVRGPKDSLKDLMNRLDKEDMKLEIHSLTDLKAERPLTARQQTILDTALREGYFDFPRRISLRKLAKNLGVTPATVTEILRRAQKRALTWYLRDASQTSPPQMRAVFEKP